MKVLKLFGIVILSLICFVIIIVFEIQGWPVGSSIAGVVLGISIPALFISFQDLADNTNWKSSQRKLKRGGFIKDSTIIRISFAYLYRIKVGDKYLLVKNKRNTGKYQPVGGVYKFTKNEKKELKNLFHVMDDNKITLDESSRNDYRLRMESKYLRKFVKRFNKSVSSRERIDNVGREFKEELLETGIIDWEKITYRYCGRYISDLRFEEHFQIYELQLFDIVELIPTSEQEQTLLELIKHERKRGQYRFATANQITCLGMNIEEGELNEWIGDHTKFTLQENESKLDMMPCAGKLYNVDL